MTLLSWEIHLLNSRISLNKETELVLVDCIQSYRMRYLVEVPKGFAEYALDTVVMKDAIEFSQEPLPEQILSHRVISRDDAFQQLQADNPWASAINSALQLENYITKT